MKCEKCCYENPDYAIFCGLCYNVLNKEQPNLTDQAPLERRPIKQVKKNRYWVTFIVTLVIVSTCFSLIYLYVIVNVENKEWYKSLVPKKYARLFNDDKYLNYSTFPPVDLTNGIPPNTKLRFYQLEGSTLEQLYNLWFIRKQKDPEFAANMDRECTANCGFEVSYSLEVEENSEGFYWKYYNFDIEVEVLLPRWNESQAANRREINKWRIWLTICKEHEYKHVQIVIDNYKILQNKILQLKATSYEELEYMTKELCENQEKIIDDLHWHVDHDVEPYNAYIKLYKRQLAGLLETSPIYVGNVSTKK